MFDGNKIQIDSTEYINRINKNFPSTILTLINIIQGVAFFILVTKTFKNFIQFDPTSICYTCIPYILIILGNLIIVSFEYTWFVGMFTGPISYLDILTVYILGFSEIFPMYYINDPYIWWISSSVFYFFGALAFCNSLYKLKYIAYKPSEAKDLVKRSLKKNVALAMVLAFLCLAVHISFHYKLYEGIVSNVGLCFVFIIFIIFVFSEYTFFKKIAPKFVYNQ